LSASSDGAVIQVSISLAVVRITGIAFGNVPGPTTSFGLSGQEAEQVVIGRALFDLSDRSPVGPNPSEYGEETRFIEGESDVPAAGLVELAEDVNGTPLRFSTANHLWRIVVARSRSEVRSAPRTRPTRTIQFHAAATSP
jgi:hypothetical protein